MKRLPHSFVRCTSCGHVYNEDFDYAEIPYQDNPNRMFNRGPIWNAHLRRVRDAILAHVSLTPVVVVVGCGRGELLEALAEVRPGGTYIGFDPQAPRQSEHVNVTYRRELFEPGVHMSELEPEIVVARHVLEHLHDPLSLLQATNIAAEIEGLHSRLFIEVPCIDRCFETGRTADFFYEHYSHFTTQSFTRMLELAGTGVDSIELGYGDEVIFGVARLGGCTEQRDRLASTKRFHDRAAETRRTVRRQLDALWESGKRIALWGGTGKAAMFINANGADANRFPLVVDSDPEKVDTYVPGTGQRIRFRDELRERPAEVIVITTQWRAREIVAEISRCDIRYDTILLEHDGQLVDYHADMHPYRDLTRSIAAA